MNVEERLHDLEAYEEIRRLIADYAHGLDKRDFARFESIWASDARWRALPDQEWVTGRKEIVVAARKLLDPVNQSSHWTANLSIRVAGDTATGLVDADCVFSSADGSWFRLGASYDDQYARRDGRWVITRRQTIIHYNLPIAEPVART